MLLGDWPTCFHNSPVDGLGEHEVGLLKSEEKGENGQDDRALGVVDPAKVLENCRPTPGCGRE